MRIVAGEFKGRRLLAPEGDEKVRPTSEKVREAVFSMLAFDIPGAYVCDLFAGTGGLGLEALSRGASFCRFSDNDRESLALVKENVKRCRAEERSEILLGDYTRILSSQGREADVYFLDPPYDAGILLPALRAIDEGGLLAEDGRIVCEHRIDFDMPEETGGLIRLKAKKYGKIGVSVYGRA